MTLRAAIYLRQSKQVDEGIERQRIRCTALVAARGWELAAEFVDNDVSATSARGPGTAWAKMLTAISNGDFSVVVSVDMDRLLRSIADLVTLTSTGATVLTVDGEVDLTTADGQFRSTLLAGLAAFETKRKSERQIRASQHRQTQGIFFGGGVRLRGYTLDGEVIEEEAVVVRRIFRQFIGGGSLIGIARELTAEGIPPRRAPRSREGIPGQKPVRKPGAWAPSSIHSILKNPRYAGRSVLLSPEVEPGTWTAGTWTAIIDGPTFEAAAARLADPRRKTNRVGTARKYLGAGLWVCHSCGRPLTTQGGRYYCSGHTSRTIDQIDAYVTALIRARLSEPDILVAFTPTDDTEEIRLTAEAARLRTRIDAIAADYDSEVIDGARYKVATDRVRAELAEVDRLRIRRATTQEAAAVMAASDPAAAFTAASLDRQRAVANALLAVTIHQAPRGSKTFRPETVEITWKTGPHT